MPKLMENRNTKSNKLLSNSIVGLKYILKKLLTDSVSCKQIRNIRNQPKRELIHSICSAVMILALQNVFVIYEVIFYFVLFIK